MRLKTAVILLLPLLFSACKDSSSSPAIPTVYFSTEINVKSQLYPDLQQDGGYAYLSDGGYKGILVVRQSANNFTAFERACPYDPTNSCMLEMDASRLYITDPCCGSQFNLQGQVIGGPAVRRLLQYKTSLVASTLYISN